MQRRYTLQSEKGSATLLAVFILMLMTMLGISATTTSSIDIQIASNDRDYCQVFYGAESGWNLAMSWLDYQYPLEASNSGLDTSSGVDFSSGKYASPDSLALGNYTNYSARIQFDGTEKASGYSTDFRKFQYTISSDGTGDKNAESQVVVTAGKVGKIGGY